MARSRKRPINTSEPDRHDPQEEDASDTRAALISRLTETYNRVQIGYTETRRERLLQWTKWAP